jgi:hypothetical protein
MKAKFTTLVVVIVAAVGAADAVAAVHPSPRGFGPFHPSPRGYAAAQSNPRMLGATGRWGVRPNPRSWNLRPTPSQWRLVPPSAPIGRF